MDLAQLLGLFTYLSGGALPLGMPLPGWGGSLDAGLGPGAPPPPPPPPPAGASWGGSAAPSLALLRSNGCGCAPRAGRPANSLAEEDLDQPPAVRPRRWARPDRRGAGGPGGGSLGRGPEDRP